MHESVINAYTFLSASELYSRDALFWQIFHVLRRSVQVFIGIMPQHRPLPLLSTFSSIHYSQIVITFNTV
jgi:hypothetical protein